VSLLPGGDPRYDVSRTGLPSWAKRDTGPLNTYVPGPISNERLENSHHTDVRLIVSGVIFVAVIVFVVVKAQADITGTVLGLIALWLLYAVPTWLRGRVGLRVDGDRCEVRGWLRTVGFAGADVAKVHYVFAGRSPDVRLVLRDGRRPLVVASRLEKGHSTLFEWLRRYAPDAEYDAKSIDIRDMLVTRGLMGAPGDAWDMYGPGRVSKDSKIGTPEEPVGEATPTPLPEEQPGEAPLRLEGSPTDEPPEVEDTIQISAEQMRETRKRLEGTLAGTNPADVPSDVEPPAEQQARAESEDS
jgi:hypothetical protein